jgi:hypothetical protein
MAQLMTDIEPENVFISEDCRSVSKQLEKFEENLKPSN